MNQTNIGWLIFLGPLVYTIAGHYFGIELEGGFIVGYFIGGVMAFIGITMALSGRISDSHQ